MDWLGAIVLGLLIFGGWLLWHLEFFSEEDLK